MKKTLTMAVVLFVMLVVVAAPVFASAKSLGSDVYALLAKYGMIVDDKDAMDAYVKKYNVTDEQAAIVLDYAVAVSEEFENENTTDYTKLSSRARNNIKSYAFAAADAVNATLKITDNTKTVTLTVIGPDGVPAYEVTVDKATGARLNGPYTGNVSTVAMISVAAVAVIAVGAMVTLKLRKEA